jgi:RNA polymerase primary sigma factor
MIRFVPSPEFAEHEAGIRILARDTVPPAGKLLSAEDEHDLFRAMNFLLYRAAQAEAAGDDRRLADNLKRAQAIRSAIVEANVRLVWHVVRKIVRRGGDFDDSIGEGNAALLRAVDTFNYNHGIRFSTFAHQGIVWGVRRARQADQRRRAIPIEYRLTRPLNVDHRPDVESADARDEWATVAELLPELQERDREVLSMRFGLGCEAVTLDEVGRRFGIGKERARQIEERALERVRELIEARRLKV